MSLDAVECAADLGHTLRPVHWDSDTLICDRCDRTVTQTVTGLTGDAVDELCWPLPAPSLGTPVQRAIAADPFSVFPVVRAYPF